jgi:uncharacterized protein (DUF2141 family)
MTYFRFILPVLLSLLSIMSKAQTETTTDSGVTIDVTFTNLEDDKGHLLVSLYSSKEAFNHKETLQSRRLKIKDKTASTSLDNIPAGTYAIICLHDRNDNGQMDFNGYMPEEAYGSSNNPVLMGPPQFDLSKFEVTDQNLSMEITMF